MMLRCMALLLAFVLLAGCANKPFGEKEFALIWKDYIKTEFVEGFDEKQSAFQREQILKKIAGKYSVDFDRFRSYLKEKHPDKHKKLFDE
jgi:hypothetical protein